jgi:hypothetical protein
VLLIYVEELKNRFDIVVYLYYFGLKYLVNNRLEYFIRFSFLRMGELLEIIVFTLIKTRVLHINDHLDALEHIGSHLLHRNLFQMLVDLEEEQIVHFVVEEVLLAGLVAEFG